MSAVKDPSSFIRSYLEEKPSGLRHLLREMQSRKREDNNFSTREKRQQIEKDNMMLEVSPSAYARVIKRKRGEKSVLLERETDLEREVKKVMRLSEQTQRIPGSYKAPLNNTQTSIISSHHGALNSAANARIHDNYTSIGFN